MSIAKFFIIKFYCFNKINYFNNINDLIICLIYELMTKNFRKHFYLKCLRNLNFDLNNILQLRQNIFILTNFANNSS